MCIDSDQACLEDKEKNLFLTKLSVKKQYHASQIKISTGKPEY
jgi:hypothetical protein